MKETWIESFFGMVLLILVCFVSAVILFAIGG